MEMVLREAFRVSAWRSGTGPANCGVEVEFLDEVVRRCDRRFNGLEVVSADFPYELKAGSGPVRWDLFSAQLDYTGSRSVIRSAVEGVQGSTVEFVDAHTVRVKPPSTLMVDGREYVERSDLHGVVVRARTNVGEIWAQGWGETIKENQFT